MRGLVNMGDHERRQGYAKPTAMSSQPTLISNTEFSGTLLGFDDFVSEYTIRTSLSHEAALTNGADMVLEDVTE